MTTIIGAVLALIFLGLPLGIVWLFVASILDRRNTKEVDGRHASNRVDAPHVQHSRSPAESAAPPPRARGDIHSFVATARPNRDTARPGDNTWRTAAAARAEQMTRLGQR